MPFVTNSLSNLLPNGIAYPALRSDADLQLHKSLPVQKPPLHQVQAGNLLFLSGIAGSWVSRLTPCLLDPVFCCKLEQHLQHAFVAAGLL